LNKTARVAEGPCAQFCWRSPKTIGHAANILFSLERILMSISKRKLEANRANAQKSTGATSPEGKATVSQNATKHGLTGRFCVLGSESQRMFDELLERFLQTEKPVDDVERELVVKMARHTWLADRAIRFQDACFSPKPRTEEQRENGVEDYGVHRELERFIRYGAAHDRAYQRAAADLAKRRKDRQLAERGFVLQQHAKRAEERRDKRERQHDELHLYQVAMAKKRVELQEAKNPRVMTAASGQIELFAAPQTTEIAA
jgi:hypothetical protein